MSRLRPKKTPRLFSLISVLLLALCAKGAAVDPDSAYADPPEGAPTAVDTVSGPDGPDPVADSVRLLRPEDLFRLHRVGEIRFSPDGRFLAFERIRSGDEGTVDRVPNVEEDRSDIWVASVEDGDRRRLTDGGADGTGWFFPRWSSDGKRLAFLSVHGNEVRAWIWKRSSGELRKATKQAVHMESKSPLLLRWRGPEELLLAVRPEGAPERGRLLAENGRPGLFAIRAWRSSWNGRTETAHVLESGGQTSRKPYHDRVEVLVVNVAAGTSRTVASGSWGWVRASPDGRKLATFRLDTIPWDRPLRQDLTGATPGVTRLGNGSRATTDRARRTSGHSSSGNRRLLAPRHESLRWAPDNRRYALLARSGRGDRRQRVVVLYETDSKTLRRVSHPRRHITDFAWTASSKLLVRAVSPGAEGADSPAAWWRVPPDGEWHRVTDSMEEVPARLIPAEDSGALGVAEGDLWRLGGDTPRSLTDDFRPRIHGMIRSERSSPSRRRSAVGLLASRPDQPGAGPGLWVARLSDDQMPRFRPLPTPRWATHPADISTVARAAAFTEEDSTGTWLWLTRPTEAASREPPGTGDRQTPRRGERTPPSVTVDTLLAEDRWLADVAAGAVRHLAYRGTDGRELTASVILPPDHRQGERHPTVVDIYPGSIEDEDRPFEARMHQTIPPAALQLLAARGYAVLLPSIPLPHDGRGVRPYLDDGVLPAVEAAVEAGLTDSSRVGLMGHSYGGYGVYHLVSQTDRFRAAVVSAGESDPRLSYGLFDARSRYGHMRRPPSLTIWRMAYLETGQGRMEVPPWQAPERYRRNSPITYVNQVATPLMMVHGDRDFVAIQHAELFYSRLLRQGKRARLVRYFGEGHILRGKANVLHWWEEIFDWFGEFLKQ